MHDEPQSPPPGFYPDRFGTERWWDGTTFTERTRDGDAASGAEKPSERASQTAGAADRTASSSQTETPGDRSLFGELSKSQEPGGQPRDPRAARPGQTPTIVGRPKPAGNPAIIGLVALLAAVLVGAGAGFGLKWLHGNDSSDEVEKHEEAPVASEAPDEDDEAPAEQGKPAPSQGAPDGLVDPNLTGDGSESERPDTQPQPTDTGLDTQDYADAFAEREQFFIDQQQPMDGSELTAKTPEQKAFISELERMYAAGNVEWTDDTETVALALTMDACETSILNRHEMDAEKVRLFADSSPLIDALVQRDRSRDASEVTDFAMETAVLGVRHICPDDAKDWQDALADINGDW